MVNDVLLTLTILFSLFCVPNFVATQPSDVGEEVLSIFSSAIFPGTKWCGPGNIAENIDDLGEEVETDTCCREHDHCPKSIPGRSTKFGLRNRSFFTK